MNSFEWEVADTPCLIKVLNCTVVAGSHSRSAPSDLDFYGYTEIDFEVCNPDGTSNVELEASMSKNERANIENLILEAHQAEQEDKYSERYDE